MTKKVHSCVLLEGTLYDKDVTIVMSDKGHHSLVTQAHIDHVVCAVTAEVSGYGQ